VSLAESLELELGPGEAVGEVSMDEVVVVDIIVADVEVVLDDSERDVVRVLSLVAAVGVTVPNVTCLSLPIHRGKYMVEVSPV
jgi:hypothetical protein